jgi:transposase
MSIVMGVDQHRTQITAEWIDLASRESSPTRVRPADRGGARRFLERFAGQELEAALEATTGGRSLVEELRAVGAVVHLAEPAETAARRGNKKHTRTDRADARHHRELLLAGRLPESWIPPDHILDLRAQARLRHALIEQHSEWQQRTGAVLHHHGCPQRRQLMKGDGRDWLAALALPAAARQQITVSLEITDALDVQLAPLTRELSEYARRQTGCRALVDRYYGIGELCAVTIRAERGDCRRFSNSRDAVRLRRDGHHRLPTRSPPRAGTPLPPGTVRVAPGAYEAAHAARRPGSPDRDYYVPAAERLGGNRARLALARKLLKRCYHTLRELGDDALAPPAADSGAARRASSGDAPGTSGSSAVPEPADALAPDPRFGPAVQQRAPASKPAHQITNVRDHADRARAPRPDSPDAARPARSLLLPTRSRGRPRKIERPRRLPQRDHPIEHLVADPGANPSRGPK